MHRLIEEKTHQALIAYLKDKRWDEVNDLIVALAKALRVMTNAEEQKLLEAPDD